MTSQIAEAVQQLREAMVEPRYLVGPDKDALCVVINELTRRAAQRRGSEGRRSKTREGRADLVTTTEVPHWGRLIAAAECPKCDPSWMQCLSTRRPDKTTVRRRWECPKCKGRFTSYDKEQAKA